VPNIKSQVKRVEVSAIENARNSAKKTKVKNAIKKFNAAVEAKDLATAEVAYRAAIGEIDSARVDGIYHINTASRKKATLARALDALKAEAKPAEAAPAKKTTKKAAKAE
jgi:small subunit ribosomal protein S20